MVRRPYRPWLSALWESWHRVCKPGAAIVLFAQSPFSHTLAMSNIRQLKTEWTWVKTSATGHLNAAKYPLKATENILVFCDRTPPYKPQMSTGHKPYTCKRGKPNSSNYGSQNRETITISDGTRYPTTVLTFPKDSSRLHPTQKPVRLAEYLIRTYTNPGDTVLDCCVGSGTTCVAALQAGRHSIGIEQDATYFDIASKRINAVVGVPCS